MAIMMKWVDAFLNSSNQTKMFVLTTVLFSLALIFSTLYSYARLDFVRSGQKPSQESTTP